MITILMIYIDLSEGAVMKILERIIMHEWSFGENCVEDERVTQEDKKRQGSICHTAHRCITIMISLSLFSLYFCWLLHLLFPSFLSCFSSFPLIISIPASPFFIPIICLGKKQLQQEEEKKHFFQTLPLGNVVF